MTLQVTIRNVYGSERIYPANEAAYTFAKIAGTVTLSRETIALVKRLGFTIEVLPEEIYTL